jgi:hypothetical protein
MDNEIAKIDKLAIIAGLSCAAWLVVLGIVMLVRTL